MTAQEQISKVVNDCVNLPVSAREMLVKGLPFTFSLPKDSHEYQQEFVGILRSTLECALNSESQIVATCEEKVKSEEAVHESAVLEHQQAVEAEADARKALQDKAEALTKASELVKKEEEMHKQAELEKSITEQQKNDLEKEVQQITSIIDGSFKMLVEGGWDGDETVKDASLQAVLDYLKRIGAEPALIAAVPGALKCLPAARGAFDGLTVERLHKVFAAKKQEADAKLQDVGLEFTVVHSEELGAFAIMKMAHEQEMEASFQKDQAQVHVRKCSNIVRAASNKVEESKKSLNEQLCERTLRENKVKEINLALVSWEKLTSGEDDTSLAVDEVNAEEGPSGAVGMDVEPTLIAGH